ncbi:MAG: hypothetical protein IT379_14330 [Deltaproteobacteria bacterium]|nr:hypothetical protein [Deltaproteobacteria bacterium]
MRLARSFVVVAALAVWLSCTPEGRTEPDPVVAPARAEPRPTPAPPPPDGPSLRPGAVGAPALRVRCLRPHPEGGTRRIAVVEIAPDAGAAEVRALAAAAVSHLSREAPTSVEIWTRGLVRFGGRLGVGEPSPSGPPRIEVGAGLLGPGDPDLDRPGPAMLRVLALLEQTNASTEPAAIARVASSENLAPQAVRMTLQAARRRFGEPQVDPCPPAPVQ